MFVQLCGEAHDNPHLLCSKVYRGKETIKRARENLLSRMADDRNWELMAYRNEWVLEIKLGSESLELPPGSDTVEALVGFDTSRQLLGLESLELPQG